MDDYFTTREVAAMLNISYAALMARIARGQVATVRRARVHFIHKDEIARMRGDDECRPSR